MTAINAVWGRMRSQPHLLLLLLPGALCFAVFYYTPMAGLVLAFQDYRMSSGLFGSSWVGLSNFEALFQDSQFLFALRNTLSISLLRLTFGFAAPIILAILLNELKIRLLRSTVQTLVYIPYFLSWIILGGIFLMLFANNGPINEGLQLFGLKPVSFLTNDVAFIGVIIGTGIWQGAGYGAVIYLAALAGISPSLYEAAAVDGAGRFARIRHITLPGLAPTIVTLFTLQVGHILNAGFDQIYNMYNPLVFDAADILDTYVLRKLTLMDFDIATASGCFKSITGLILILSVNSIVKRATRGEQGIF